MRPVRGDPEKGGNKTYVDHQRVSHAFPVEPVVDCIHVGQLRGGQEIHHPAERSLGVLVVVEILVEVVLCVPGVIERPLARLLTGAPFQQGIRDVMAVSVELAEAEVHQRVKPFMGDHLQRQTRVRNMAKCRLVEDMVAHEDAEDSLNRSCIQACLLRHLGIAHATLRGHSLGESVLEDYTQRRRGVKLEMDILATRTPLQSMT